MLQKINNLTTIGYCICVLFCVLGYSITIPMLILSLVVLLIGVKQKVWQSASLGVAFSVMNIYFLINV